MPKYHKSCLTVYLCIKTTVLILLPMFHINVLRNGGVWSFLSSMIRRHFENISDNLLIC